MSGHSQLRLALLLAVTAAAVAIGFFLVPPRAAVDLVQRAGYYAILLASLLFAVALAQVWRNPENRPQWDRQDLAIALVSLALAALWQVHGLRGFKTLMDECDLSATAMSMHFDREVFMPLRVHNIHGVNEVLGGLVDKRPLFFPFVLSVVHDLTGYRLANVFWLNAGLSALALFLAGQLARRLAAGSMRAGVLAVLLLGGVPLFASSATGGGFEILNLVMICSVMLLALRTLREPSPALINALVLGTVLLAQTRYESALYVGATAVVVVASWRNARRFILPWSLFAAPLLLIAIPLQHNVLTITKGYFETEPGSGGPFQTRFFLENLGHAVQFLFAVDGFQLGSPLLAAVGLPCLCLGLVHALRRAGRTAADARALVWVAFALVTVANVALLLCYFWGQLDDFVASRLALPLLLAFALAFAFAAGAATRRAGVWWTSLAVAGAWLFVAAVPIVDKARSQHLFLTANEVEFERQFVNKHRDGRNLFVMPSPLPAILERQAGLPVGLLNERAEQMRLHLQQGTYGQVFVFQRFMVDGTEGGLLPEERSVLGPQFVLETVAERKFQPLTVFRVSRLVGVDSSRAPVDATQPKKQYPIFDIELRLTGNTSTSDGRDLRKLLLNLP